MSEIIDRRATQFLKHYINTYAPSGYELEGQYVWLDHLLPYLDGHYIDNYFNAVGVVNPGQKFQVMLEAHADEISWLVNYISPEGFIHVIKNGGTDEMVALGKHVQIHTAEGLLHGVFGWPAIHLRDTQNLQNVQISHLFVDCGFDSGEEAEKAGIRVGDVVTYKAGFCRVGENFYCGRALDNRIGGFIIAQVVRLLRNHGIRLPFTLLVVNAVQEEVGLNGAKMISGQLNPDIAIVTDVTHDTTTPHISKHMHGHTKCGNGPVLAVAPAVQKGLLRFITEVAHQKGIPYQWLAVSRKTGTDAHAIALANGGTCTALVSPPLRYMHTPVEMVHKRDVEDCIRLILEVLMAIDPETLELRHSFKYMAVATQAK